MTIIKPGNIPLSTGDLLTNVEIDFSKHIVSISYCYTKNVSPYDPIGFIEIKDGEDISFLQDYINFLNNENLAALIWIENKDNCKPNIPFFITPYLCCSYEGKFDLLKNKSDEMTIENILININKILDISQDSGRITRTLWEKTIDYKDSMVFMNNKGDFSFIKEINFYTYNNIKYCYYNQLYKPLQPIKISQNTKTKINGEPAFSWENYADCCY